MRMVYKDMLPNWLLILDILNPKHFQPNPFYLKEIPIVDALQSDIQESSNNIN